MRKIIFSSFVAGFAFFIPTAGHAQIATICPTCVQQSSASLQWAKQLANMAQQLQNQYSQLASLKGQFYANTTGNLSTIRQLGNSQALTNGSLTNIINRLQSGNYPVSGYSDLQNQLLQSHQVFSKQLVSLKDLLAQQQNEYAADAQAVSSAQSQAKTTIGVHQAANVSNELQGQMASTLLKIQQTDMATAQTLATAAAVQNDREASAEAQQRTFLSDDRFEHPPAGKGY